MRGKHRAPLPKVPVELATEIWEELSNGAEPSSVISLLTARNYDSHLARRLATRFDRRFQNQARRGQQFPELEVESDLVDLGPGEQLRTSTAMKDGGGFLALGLVLGYMSVAWPIQQADEGAETIEIYSTAMGVSVIAVVVGLGYILLGKRARTFWPPTDNTVRSENVVFMVVVATISVVVYFAIRGYLESAGYAEIY